MSKLYIAYGSNINREQMKYRCPTAVPLGVAALKDYDLEFRGAPDNAYATIAPSDGEVPVLVWSVTDADEFALDRYEGYPRLYRKEMVSVELDGENVEAMVYIMNGQELNLPSDLYLRIVREGYESAGLDTAVLDRALYRSAQTVEQGIGQEV